MKKLFLVPILLVILSLVATPVLAVDPIGTEVEVIVITPDAVDLDVKVVAGGDVDVTIDGVDFKQTANLARQAYVDANRPTNGAFDFRYYYWTVTEVGRDVVDQFNRIWQTINLLIESQAKMILELEAANARIDELESRIKALERGN